MYGSKLPNLFGKEFSVPLMSLLKKKPTTITTTKQTYVCNEKQIKLPDSVGFDLVPPAFLALVGMTRVRRMSSTTPGLSGGDDVPYNIKDEP